MAQTNFRSRLESGEALLGCFLTWPTGGVVEMLSLTGFDFVVVDSEHGVFSLESIATMIVAADAANLPAIVRVPSCPSVDSARCLDYGAAGILFPRAGGVETVRAATDGVRPLPQFVAEANRETTVVVQIETQAALDDLGPISKEKSVDVLYVGPNDLTQVLGIPTQINDLRYQSTIERIAAVAKEAGKIPGIMLGKADQIPALRKMGYRFFTTSDRVVFMESARSWRAALSTKL